MTMMCSSMSDVTRAVGNTGRILTEILSFRSSLHIILHRAQNQTQYE